ncbi:MAG TPA: alpha/beta hydrolase [Rhodanobacteraceae bacterium]|jgi:pimeloyl-ACP methyl ester carboxylesterase|nr:alpha/beta hydrolase [Rhodanobacteraceae bacterium]
MENSGAPAGALSRLIAADGLALTVETRGPSGAPPVLFAHGFGQSRLSWARTASALAEDGWRTVTFDARGHGDSGRLCDGAYHLEQFVADLLAISASLAEPPVMVGHSMGGLLAMVAAGEVRPTPFRALVLVDITPRWEASGVARILGFMRAHLDGFASLEEAAERVAAYAPQRSRGRSLRELEQLLRRGGDGRWRWRWDPSLLDTIAVEGERHQRRLIDAARHIDAPVLLVSGGRSDVVSERTVAEFLRNVPSAEHVEVPHATHAVAGDDSDAFVAVLAYFLKSLGSPPPRARAECDAGDRTAGVPS